VRPGLGIVRGSLIDRGSTVKGLGVRSLIPVARLTDADPLSESSDFTATVHWGDGTTPAGAVAATGAGRYTITAGHAYDDGGNFTITTTVADPGGGASATSTATILPLPDTSITFGPNGGVYIWTTAPAYQFTSTIPGSTFQCSVDGRPFAPCTSGHFIGPLAAGDHSFRSARSARRASPTGPRRSRTSSWPPRSRSRPAA
jgi:hypothetical protein